ncbi:hypothetical protein PITC_022410 [Penicillium italicum]|uniref:Uncharacterized protein n=1 Tax=Penicillium italicum TaxID=40296 RepID=A0A0A2KBZ0_PENIT|nr:hypothetical protein PITC_022410 [Penicillium italicum]
MVVYECRTGRVAHRSLPFLLGQVQGMQSGQFGDGVVAPSICGGFESRTTSLHRVVSVPIKLGRLEASHVPCGAGSTDKRRLFAAAELLLDRFLAVLDLGQRGQGGSTNPAAEADGGKHLFDARESQPCSKEAYTLNLRTAKESVAEMGVVADQSSVAGIVKGNIGDSLERERARTADTTGRGLASVDLGHYDLENPGETWPFRSNLILWAPIESMGDGKFTVTVPKGVAGQSYFVLTKGNKQATDDNIVGKKGAMGTLSGMAAMGMGGKQNSTFMPTPSSSMSSAWSSTSSTTSPSSSPMYTGAAKKIPGSIAGVFSAALI